MPFRHALSVLSLSLLAAVPLWAQAAPKYTVTVVGIAGSSATGINYSGAVIGHQPSGANTHGFVNKAGVITDLGTLGGLNSMAAGINNAGKIVGNADDGFGRTRAFLWVGGVMTDLGTFGGDNSAASAINNHGDIVGSADMPPGPGSYSSAFLLRPKVLMQDLGRIDVPDPEGGSHAAGLNDNRKVVGGSVVGPFTPPESPFHAFLYGCEDMKDLGTLGGQFSNAYAINSYGKVVGEASTPELMNNRAFSYFLGVKKNLGTLPGGGLSSARAINDKGEIVGLAMAALGEGGWQKAFLYRLGTMHDLNALINPGLGWSLREARGINNKSQIAATGCKAGKCYALRLDPLP
ncbi:MAG TPA: HAF repeat-containing protein [Telluria sp.]|jgi:probable HAF family extracellular repeat protein